MDLQKQYRIKKGNEIEEIMKKRNSFSNKYFIIYRKNNETEHFRFAISVPKKVGNAVFRNKTKRRIREIIRLNKCTIKKNDFFIIVRKELIDLDFNEIKYNLLNLMKKIDLIKEVDNEKTS